MRESDIALFDTQGFVKIPHAISAESLHDITACIEACISSAIEARGRGEKVAGIAMEEQTDAMYVVRINDALSTVGVEVLALMGHPAVVAIAKALCGEDAVPIYESVVVRNRGDNAPVLWHQDMVHQRQSRIVTLGVHLDEAGDDSALLFLPATQTTQQDICALTEHYGYDGKGIVRCSVLPGDILLHDVMVVHASQPLQLHPQRRTLYIEFRSAAYARNNEGFSAEWIALRQELFTAAQRVYVRFCESSKGHRKHTVDEQALVDTIAAMRWRIETGHYCFEITEKTMQEEKV